MYKQVIKVTHGSMAHRAGIKPFWKIVSVNGHKITDVLDYNFYSAESRLKMVFTDENGRERIVKIRKKDPYMPLGLTFKTYLMDKAKSCRNNCIFCFIDQLPKNMRKTLYFKDDDHRLSFLTGNYVTLTNATDEEINRITEQRISPINISVHAIDPDVRIAMTRNKNAGKIKEIMERFAAGRVLMNAQIVLCKGINDGNELIKTFSFLKTLHPWLTSVSVVPVGLTKFREGLYPLLPFSKKDAAKIIKNVEHFGDVCKKEMGTRLVYPADELYIKADIPMPEAEFYEDFPQLENGVGLIASLKEDFMLELENIPQGTKGKTGTIASGVDAAPFIKGLIDEAAKKCDNLEITVYPIKNRFFGESVTVSGLLTGHDLIEELKDKELSGCLFIPSNMLRDGEEIFLDGLTVQELSSILKVPVFPIDSTGFELLKGIIEEW